MLSRCSQWKKKVRKQRARGRFRAAASIARLCTGFQGSAGEEGEDGVEEGGDSRTEDSEHQVNGHVNGLTRELTLEE